jgi:transposase
MRSLRSTRWIEPRRCCRCNPDCFLKQVAKAYPEHEQLFIRDNYAAHKRVEIRDWLAANPRVQVHFTPTSASWMNMVEIWFGIIEPQAIHRGSFGSVKDLNTESAPS